MMTASKKRVRVLAGWPLIVAALVVRLTFGTLAPSDVAWHADLDRLSFLSVICAGDVPPSDRHHDHHVPPADTATLVAEAQELLDLPLDAISCFVGALVLVLACFWVFPPVRGPPRRGRSSLYPRGPPHLT